MTLDALILTVPEDAEGDTVLPPGRAEGDAPVTLGELDLIPVVVENLCP